MAEVLSQEEIDVLLAATESPRISRAVARRYPILSPSKADPGRLRKAVGDIYEVNGLARPDEVILCGNPIAPVFAMAMLDSIEQPFRHFGEPYHMPQRNLEALLNRMCLRFQHQSVSVHWSIQQTGGIAIGRLAEALKFDRILHDDADYGGYKGLEFLFGRNAAELFRSAVIRLAEDVVRRLPHRQLNGPALSRFNEKKWVQWENIILRKFYRNKLYDPFLNCYHPNCFEDPDAMLVNMCLHRRYSREYPEFRELEPFFAKVMEFYTAGGWLLIPFGKVAFVVLKPQSLSTDERNRPHNPNGPAVVFQDMVPMYFFHGWPVPEEFVLDPRKLAFWRIYCEPNVEVRRLMISRMGLRNFLPKEGRCDIIDADFERNNPNPRKLYRVVLKEDEPLYILHLVDPSKLRVGQPADVFLRVPPTMETCAQAVAWTFGYENVSAYRPMREE